MKHKSNKTPIARYLYLIIRGEKPSYQRAPYHPVIVCTRKHTAKWEAGETGDGSTVFQEMAPNGEWLLVKYKGFNMDYSKSCTFIDLFDGKNSREIGRREEIMRLIKEAVWWSYDRVPDYAKDWGIRFPEDTFTKKIIIEDAGMCLLPESKAIKLEDKLDEYDLPAWLILTEE